MNSSPSFYKKVLARLAASRFITISLLIHIALIVLLGGAVLFKVANSTESFVVSDPGGFLQESVDDPTLKEEQPAEFEEPDVQTPAAGSIAPASSVASLALNSSFAINNPSDMQVFTNSSLTHQTLSGMGGTGGATGRSGASGGGMSSSFFGSSSGGPESGLTGVYYDCRRTPAGQVDAEWEKYARMSDTSGWGGEFGNGYLRFCEKLFDRSGRMVSSLQEKMYRAPKQLSNYVILMPVLPSDRAPAAFGVDRVPGRQAWVVQYQARLKPESGSRFRFVGGGDELLIVRVNGRLVLDATWQGIPWQTENRNPTNWKPKETFNGPYSDRWKTGEWFTVNGSFDLEITVGEGWGGAFAGVLTIEESDKNYDKAPRPLFKVEGYEQMLPLIQPVVASHSQYFTLDGPVFRRAQ